MKKLTYAELTSCEVTITDSGSAYYIHGGKRDPVRPEEAAELARRTPLRFD